MITVTFHYLTGLKRSLFDNVRLTGSWNDWAEIAMTKVVAEDGCWAFVHTVEFDDAEAGKPIRWGVRHDGPSGANVWGIGTEVHDPDSQERHREFRLPGAGGVADERYHLSWGRRLGAHKFHAAGGAKPAIRFTVWSVNAQSIDVVFAPRDRPYIAKDGSGIDPGLPPVALTKEAGDIWVSPPVPDFERFAGVPYMFRIRNAQGVDVFRTDLYSRWQAGRGWMDPAAGSWDGQIATLDGRVSCSVVIDQDVVRKEFEPKTDPPVLVTDEDFWKDEHNPAQPVPTRIDDLVIYELHVGALGFGHDRPGNLLDAMALLDHLSALGVNAVELMPLTEFPGEWSWGYGNTHHFAIESSAGGRDKYKHFVRECHRRGIAVIQDVVYNHFANDAERAEWQYDSTSAEDNIYYWHESRIGGYPDPEDGYLDNDSSGYAPRYWAQPVRQMFISSALHLIEEFHVDGFRVDLTEAIYGKNHLRRGGPEVRSANMFGRKLLREWSRALRMIRPSTFLIAEDHSGCPLVTMMPSVGGLGFDSTWFAHYYHSLVGDSHHANGTARLLREAGFGHDGALPMQQFSGALWQTQFDKVAYHESHDEAGNDKEEKDGRVVARTARTSKVAVNGAALVGPTRDYAEARCRVICGLSMLSAATPMFFMGEEIVAQKLYLVEDITAGKEDLHGERAGAGAKMFRYYQDLIRLRRKNEAVRSRHIDIVAADDSSRVIAFTRRAGRSGVLVVVSLNNHPFLDGYVIVTQPDRLPDGSWQETFNSDSALYGGNDVGNFGAAIPAVGGRIQLRLPANGLLVLQRR